MKRALRVRMYIQPRTGKLIYIGSYLSVTIASILRLVYMIHRFYFDLEFTNHLYTEFQVNMIR